MAWQEPVTDRTDGAYMAVADCNRITGNLRELDGTATLPADVTSDTILTVTWMTQVLAALRLICLTLGISADGLSDEWTYQNINLIESKTKECYDFIRLSERQEPLTIFAGEIYVGQGNYYGGGF